MKNLLLPLVLLVFCYACAPPSNQAPKATANPAAPGFNAAASDAKAIQIADQVMEAMGGRQQWDDLHYISWDFFGARQLLWDKWGGRVRIDSPRDSSVYLVDLRTLSGKVWRHDTLLTDPDQIAQNLQKAKSIWINDSYWLVMPFKLKDSGVSLKYLRQDSTQQGQAAEVLELTFAAVGDTPENKYEVYVDQSDHLIKQWAFFKSAQQDTASAIWPWDNYQDFGGLLLSADRSDGKGPREVEVFTEMEDKVFEERER